MKMPTGSLFLIASMFCLSFSTDNTAENANKQEFNNGIIQLEHHIWSLKNYRVDTSGNHWTATDPTGCYSFEGDKRKPSAKMTTYVLTLKSFIYDVDYFQHAPDIKVPFHIYGRTGDKNLQLNFGTEVLEGDYPFDMEKVKVVYKEKQFYISFSPTLVFDRINFEESYIVSYKNGEIKKYTVDPVSRKFEAAE
ncbi:hypothetical protein ACTHGU_09465 [Chitinophagaceae bacterium MMS25-I14]